MLQIERHAQTETKVMENVFHENIKKNRVGIAILILDKIDFKTKALTTKQGPPIPLLGSYLKKTKH